MRVPLLAAASLAAVPVAFARATPPLWTTCADGVDWFSRVDTPDTEARMMELVMESKLADWSREWIGAALEEHRPADWLAEAQRRSRPVFWFVPAIEGQHVILPHLAERYVEIGVLSDPDLAELLNRRFVPVKCPAAGEVAARFGLVPPDFVEPGFLVLSPDGEVLASVGGLYTFRAAPQRELLIEILEELGDEAATSASFDAAHERWSERPDGQNALSLAREARLEGLPRLAESLLAELVDVPEALLLGARLARERRDLAVASERLDALAALEEHALEDGSREDGAIDVERGRLALEAAMPGDTAAVAFAAERLRAAWEAGGTRAAEAGYLAGAALFLSKREAAAQDIWKSVASAYARTEQRPWAARSDAYWRVGTDGLRGEGPLTRSMEGLAWCDAATRAHGTRGPRSLDDLEAVVERAVGFLIEQQRSDGAWYGARWGGGGQPAQDEPWAEGPGLFSNIHTPISALACAALLAWRDVRPAAIDAALERADGYLLRDDLVTRGESDTMWVYADAFRLLYYARRHPDPKQRPEIVEASMNGWVGELVRHQEATGGHFKHYSYTSTFVTAMVLIGLMEAESVGVPIPAGVYDRAAERLEAARAPKDAGGLFGYLADSPTVNRTVAGAICRQPLCTWVLYRCGRTDAADVVDGVSRYLDSYRSVIEPPRKSNFHMPALDGSAGYFFFHNFLATAMATRDCGGREREFTARLRELLVELPEIDGSFVDSGISYGKSYGTAAALLSLAELAD